MAATRISNAAAIAACDAIVDLLDVGSPNGYIEIRDGTQPADPDTAAAGTLLATLNLSATAFGAAADATPGGQATAASISDDTSADATSTATWFRAYDAGGTAIIDGDVNTAGGDLNLNSTSITAGGTVSITSWTVTVPES